LGTPLLDILKTQKLMDLCSYGVSKNNLDWLGFLPFTTILVAFDEQAYNMYNLDAMTCRTRVQGEVDVPISNIATTWTFKWNVDTCGSENDH